MGKIDISSWKEFRIGDFFEAERGKVKNIQPLCPGETPIIAAGAYNQGIAGMYEIDSAYENRITISCNGAGCGSTFYHPYKFNVNGDAITLIEKDSMSDKAKGFIACILNGVFTRKYSYEEKCSPQKALDEIVRLPSTPDGAPDWAYMESYIANLETKVAESLTMLQVAKDAEKKKVDTREWKESRIGDYFKVEYGRFHAKDELGAGTINYITTSGFNNGITNTCEEATHQGNCITVASDGAMGASFYQEEAFTTSNIVSTLTPLPHTPLNKYNAFFLCAIIFGKRAEFGWLGFKMSVDRVRNLRVKLPSTPDGQPDWVYMEEYMRKVERKTEGMFNQFIST